MTTTSTWVFQGSEGMGGMGWNPIDRSEVPVVV